MAELICAQPALGDLDAIADYVELDDPEEVARPGSERFQHVEQLAAYPESGVAPRELRGSRYRQIIEPPCRIFYRYDGERVFILYVMRGEMRLREKRLSKRERQIRKT